MTRSVLKTQCGSRVQKKDLPLPELMRKPSHPALVLGAGLDPIVDEVDCQEIAEYVNGPFEVIHDSGHDIMLDVSWQAFADKLLAFATSLKRTAAKQ
jgi:pimeloyl-ACP methyl ester carboxylesterase